MSSPQTTTDLAAVVDAIRSHDRFLVTTHENPDGDALGSLLAAKLGLDALAVRLDLFRILHGREDRRSALLGRHGIRRSGQETAAAR